MSIVAMNWAMKQRTDGPSAQIVLYVIADTANERGVSHHANPDYIADRSRQSRETVFRRLKELERVGALKRIVRHLDDGRRDYEIRLQLDADIDYETVPERPEDPALQESPPQDVVAPPPVAVGGECQIDTQPVSPVTEGECHSGHPLKSPSKNPEREMRARVREDSTLATLKGLWPTTAHDDQEHIGRAWENLTDGKRDAAVDRAPDWLDSLKKIGRKYVPPLWKYLEQGMWEHLPAKAKDAEGGPAQNPNNHPPHSPAGRALANLARIARYNLWRLSDGSIPYQGAITPQLLALASVPEETASYPRGSASYAAWRRFIDDVFAGRPLPLLPAIEAPWPFPPRVDGTISPPSASTGPPHPFLTEDDEAHLVENGL